MESLAALGLSRTRSLVLASASPRRRELLAQLDVPFEAVATAVEELTEGDPAELVVANALHKARAGRALAAPEAVVVGVDTDVTLGGAVLGKPADAAGAERRLRELSGRTHEVLSGVAVIGPGLERTGLERTLVSLRDLTEGEIAAYVAAGEWRDRAGGYAIQGLGSALVDRVDGDLSNVIGLPIPLLSGMIASLQDR